MSLKLHIGKSIYTLQFLKAFFLLSKMGLLKAHMAKPIQLYAFYLESKRFMNAAVWIGFYFWVSQYGGLVPDASF